MTPTRCPKCRQRLPFRKTGRSDTCPTCGTRISPRTASDIDAEPRLDSNFDDTSLTARAILLVVLFAWSISMVKLDYRTGENGSFYMHGILLVFHEAWHVLFMPFGQFMTILGGSLFQVMLPLMLGYALLWKNQDTFGACIAVWWCGVSLVDLAPYIYDAKNPQMIMLGGHTGADGPHDWIYLLSHFNKLAHSPAYGTFCYRLGVLVIFCALLYAAKILWSNHQEQRE